jgi:hypothetical protein
MRSQAQRQVFGVVVEQTFIGAGESVFGKQRDYVEERAADFIVKIFRRELFGKLVQPAANIGSKRLEGSARQLYVRAGERAGGCQ